jgi:hypothetical protein
MDFDLGFVSNKGDFYMNRAYNKEARPKIAKKVFWKYNEFL